MTDWLALNSSHTPIYSGRRQPSPLSGATDLEDALVGHEELEAVDACSRERFHVPLDLRQGALPLAACSKVTREELQVDSGGTRPAMTLRPRKSRPLRQGCWSRRNTSAPANRPTGLW